MRVAAVQLNSTATSAGNLETAERLVARGRRGRRRAGRACPRSGACSAPARRWPSGAEPLDGPTLDRGAELGARARGRHLLAGSVAERVPGRELLSNTSLLIDPDGEIARDLPQDPHVRRRRRRRRLPRVGARAAPATRSSTAPVDATGRVLGLTVCYDLRFPELFRILALRGAGVITVPSAFTAVTGRDHWEVLLRARAIENQLFVIAAGQVGEAPPHYDSWGHSMIVDPWGEVLDVVAGRRGPRDRRARPRRAWSGSATEVPSLANRRADAYRWPEAGGGVTWLTAEGTRRSTSGAAILDAAVRVFARQGYHATRVADIADEAGVAYGLVYHYFRSKEAVMTELFTERWSLLLAGERRARRARTSRRARSSPGSPASSSTPTATTRS